MNNILNYIAKDIKEGEALQEALAGLQDQAWIVGDTARRMVTNSGPENANGLDLVLSCDEHQPTLEVLSSSFKVNVVGNSTYTLEVGPLPVRITFADIGEYLATRRYAGDCVAVNLTKKVPVTTPEFFFAPPTAEVGSPELPATKDEQLILADLVIFEAHLAERMANQMKDNLNKPASEVIQVISNQNPESPVATD